MAGQLKRIFSIACYGTSLTTGRLSTAWPTAISVNLDQFVDRKVRVFDMGKGSQNSQWGVDNMGFVAMMKPDLILFEGFGINDAVVGGPPGLTRAQHVANIDTMIAYWQANTPSSRLCIQTMNPVSAAGSALRADLANYYADELARAAAHSIDSLDHYGDWPNPLPDALTQVDPTTGLPDGLHPTLAANRQYFYPKTLEYLLGVILGGSGGGGGEINTSDPTNTIVIPILT